MINREQLFQNRALQWYLMYILYTYKSVVSYRLCYVHMAGHKGNRRGKFERLLWFFVSLDFYCDYIVIIGPGPIYLPFGRFIYLLLLLLSL